MSKGIFLKPLTDPELDYLATRFRLLGEPMRLRILQAVCHDTKTVNEIVVITGSTQANVSKHLTLLASAGILSRKKDGQCVIYGMKDKMVMQLCSLVRSQVKET
jgi:DNA-binding transcriptional ArsR family regulator